MTELERIIEQIKNGQAKNITNINLISNQLGEDGAIAFAEALKEANLHQLRYILLSNNEIGDEGAIALAEALKEANLPNLEEIYLSLNKIGDEGAIAFAKALKGASLPHLRMIYLSSNQIGDEGAIALAKALKEANLPHLEVIILYRNKICFDTAIAVIDALKEANLPNPGLISFNSYENGDMFVKVLFDTAMIARINSKYIAEAKEKAKQKLQLNWDSTAKPIKKALIDIEYAKLLQQVGKLKVAIDLYGAALHSFRHSAEAIPEFLNVKQIVKQATEGMKIAIKEHKEKVGKLKLPVFVLECFEHLNAKIFERDLLLLFADLGVDATRWDPNLAGSILNMLPSGDVSDFSFDAFRKLAATDSKDESDAYNITGDVGTTSQAHG